MTTFKICIILKIKVIQGIFKQNIKPKCQIKWEEQYGGNIDWTQIWTKLKKFKVNNKVIEFQWKCLQTFMNFSGIAFFILENSEIQFLLSINKLYIS
jgi:hypothetical protein